MERKAACDHSFAFDPNLDYEAFFKQWVPLVEDLITRECRLYVLDEIWVASSVDGSVINWKTILPFKEIRDSVIRLISKMDACDFPECEGRATEAVCQSIRLEHSEVKQFSCGGKAVHVTYVGDQISVQEFWRSLLASAANEAEFEAGIELAFWSLEIGPEGRERWNDTGHAFVNIKANLLVHLRYLNDYAVSDWNSSGGQDPMFAKLASAKGVLLSRDESRASVRMYNDGKGGKQTCRHHTKLNPQGTSKSAYYGGRIYFAVENQARVFIGKICEHD